MLFIQFAFECSQTNGNGFFRPNHSATLVRKAIHVVWEKLSRVPLLNGFVRLESCFQSLEAAENDQNLAFVAPSNLQIGQRLASF